MINSTVKIVNVNVGGRRTLWCEGVRISQGFCVDLGVAGFVWDYEHTLQYSLSSSSIYFSSGKTSVCTR